MVAVKDHLPPVNPYKMAGKQDDEEEHLSGKGPGPKTPVLPRQLRHMHRLHAAKKHAQADNKRRLPAPLGKEGKPKHKEGGKGKVV